MSIPLHSGKLLKAQKNEINLYQAFNIIKHSRSKRKQMVEENPKITKVLVLLIVAPIILLVTTMIFAIPVFIENQGESKAISEGIVELLPYILITNHLVLFVLLLLFMRSDRITFSSIGWSHLDNKRALFLELLIGIVSGIVLFWFYTLALSPAIELAQNAIGNYQSEITYKYTGIDKIVWLLAITVFAGVVEESIYRGYAICCLGLRIGIGWALVLSSVLFGPLHFGMGIWAMVETMILGVLLGGIFVWRRNLLAPAVAHAILNLLIEF